LCSNDVQKHSQADKSPHALQCVCVTQAATALAKREEPLLATLCKLQRAPAAACEVFDVAVAAILTPRHGARTLGCDALPLG
jgi:hypothetical protein